MSLTHTHSTGKKPFELKIDLFVQKLNPKMRMNFVKG